MDTYEARLGKKRVLELLRKRGSVGVYTEELHDPAIGGLEGTRRLRELRADGYAIQREKVSAGRWLYWLGPPRPKAQIDLWGNDDE